MCSRDLLLIVLTRCASFYSYTA
uniref:Uncharacterized protein n=1 Tax=Rhizophora mucronata TaxID=61149 RepID=A0A2P2PQY4_RHIMU